MDTEHALYRYRVTEAKAAIGHSCDGPVTAYVMMSRALQHVEDGNPIDATADALWDEMRARGFLTEDGLRVT